MVRYAAGQPTEVIADAHAGAPFNEPNDLAVDAAGRVWFSDPNYGERPLAQPRESVYRCDPSASGWKVTEVTTDTNRPNGVLLSADQSILYVAESPRRLDQRRQLRAYPIQDDGSLGDHTLLHDFGAGARRGRHVPGIRAGSGRAARGHRRSSRARSGAGDLRARRQGAAPLDPSDAGRPAHQLHLRRRRSDRPLRPPSLEASCTAWPTPVCAPKAERGCVYPGLRMKAQSIGNSVQRNIQHPIVPLEVQ